MVRQFTPAQAADFALGSVVDLSRHHELASKLQVTYSLPERRAPLAPPTMITAPAPVSNIRVVEQLVGATVVRLENGDVLNIRVFVDSMILNVEAGHFEPRYRIVPEVVLGGKPGGMRYDVEPGEVRN